MPEARKIPLPIATGIVLNKTEYEAQGRYIDCDHIRFIDGQPEKIGGWEQWNLPGDELTALCRAIACWQDFNYNVWHAFGCVDRLWVFDQDKSRSNITPFVSTGTLTDPFSTTDTLTTVTVADTAHGLRVGQYINFSGASAVGGLTISGEYQVATVIDADSYTIEHASAATSTAGPGGGSVAYSYELAPGNTNVTTGGGWGIGTWGTDTWGEERPSTTYIQLPRQWSLDRYGQDLLAMPTNGTVYRWSRNPANRAAALANAPTRGEYMFVTSERIIVVLGADGDFMLMKWCDDDDPTLWTPAEDNTANIRRLQEGNRLMGGTRLAQAVNLVWSDTAVYLMQFTGNNNVYSTRVVGTNCGLISPASYVIVDGIAFWMSPTGTFHMYGGTLSHMPRADEIEKIFQDINNEQRFKIHCFFNPEHREIWWFYPSTGNVECDKYVMVNLETFDWVVGNLDRTAFGLCSLLGSYTILATDQSGVIYEHETGVDADGLALDWHVETGFMDLEDGNAGLDIDGYIPDFFRQTGTIDLTFTSRDLPEDTANLETVTKEIAQGETVIDLRHFGRQSKMKLSQTGIVGGDFRLGAQRLEVRGTASKRHD
jgi:hypothetical protein